MAFGIPSMIMLVIEWVSFEVMGIYAGILGVYPLGAHTILSNLMTLFYMIPLGLSFATMAHIGTSLGRGEYKLARRYFYISYVISGLIAIITVFILNYFRKHIFTVYTSDEKILEIIHIFIAACNIPNDIFRRLAWKYERHFQIYWEASRSSILYFILIHSFW